ncbi:MAG: DUF896 domain-containing protein [Firmicutes bacterium]|nr:DUF896 domain-containing protein [Bacillota bacterium]
MKKEKIDRISCLSRKARSEGLSEAEKAEQKLLRDEYIAAVKANLRATLDNIEIVDKK